MSNTKDSPEMTVLLIVVGMLIYGLIVKPAFIAGSLVECENAVDKQ